jgi:hypothetical protein
LPKVPDCDPPPVRRPQQPTQLERLARELDADADELRWWLRDEIALRVAQAGGNPETTPGPHQQRT